MTDEEVDALLAELTHEGKIITPDEAREAVRKVSEILYLASREGLFPEPLDEEVSDLPQSPSQ